MPQLSMHTPLGDLTFSEEDGAIVAVDWGWGRDQAETPLLLQARAQMDEYLDGERTRFDLALAPAGSAYRRRVWAALCDIPPGTTRTYADIARVAGGSARSVGQANGANPIPVLIPCHRVVAAGYAAQDMAGMAGMAGAHVGGYSGGDGLATKRFLLQLENRTA